MRKYSLLSKLLVLVFCVFFITACSKETLTLETIKDVSDSEREWTDGLEQGVYLKKLSDAEGILYVNLNSEENLYRTIEATLEQSKGNPSKIMITEEDALQDSEVSSEYFAKLESNEDFGEIEVYLNGKKETLTIIE